MPITFGPAIAGPNGATVVGGAATIQGQGSANVIVNQSTQNAIINWQTFNIGSGETTRIYTPNSASAQLDRVTGGQGPSQILGTLSSNGKVFLVNPDGILFGMGARINVGSLVATTSDIANKDFMAGRYNFSIPGNPNASVVNMGSITAQSSGFAALVAPGVRNTGTITARLGTIALASGNAFTLDMYGDNLITLGLSKKIDSQVIDVATGKPLKSLVDNTGKLKANGGTVVLTAVSARRIVDSVINNSGVIEANTFASHNGKIVLGGPTRTSRYARAHKSTVTVSGTLSAAGKRKGTTGGTIQITGANIQVAGATIDASGQAGGGTVLIGGDWGGGHPNNGLASGNASAVLQPSAVPNANTVSIDAATMIDASATEAGNGGKVVVWANQATTFVGTILAKGGAQAGNGGYVETSGGTLTFNGAVNTSAANGKAGTWLLDPTDLTIDAAGAATISNGLANNNVVVYTNADGASSQGTKSSGAGDIIVASGISWSSDNTLSLDAYHNVIINSAISGTNGGLTLNASNSISAIAAVSVGTFILQNGNWTQISSNLPVFSASDFRITSGSFLRALGGNGTLNSPYQLADIYSVQGIGAAPSFSKASLLGDNFVLNQDIDASVTATWNGGAGFRPIGTLSGAGGFSGIFDGQGHVISNLTIKSMGNTPGNSIGGLFTGVTGAVVRNLGLTNINIQTDALFVGTIAGVLNSGSITNSYATGNLVTMGSAVAGGLVGSIQPAGGAISQSHSDIFIQNNDGTHGSGGLVGQMLGGSITDSYAHGAIVDAGALSSAGGLVGGAFGSAGPVQIIRSFATGSVSVGDNGSAGGLVGAGDGSIKQSYATGAVTAGKNSQAGGLVGNSFGSVSQSFATGSVSAGDNSFAGGLVGFSVRALTQSFATGSVSVGDNGSAGGLVGLAAQLEDISQVYATGGVRGGANAYVGGLIGQVDYANITQAYASGAVSGGVNSSIGGLVGGGTQISATSAYWDAQATGQLHSAGSPDSAGLPTFKLVGGLPSGFDPSVWTNQANKSYPYFPWQPVNTRPIPGFIPPPPVLPPYQYNPAPGNNSPGPGGQTNSILLGYDAKWQAQRTSNEYLVTVNDASVDVAFTALAERFSTSFYVHGASSGPTVGHGVDFGQFKFGKTQLANILNKAISTGTADGSYPNNGMTAEQWVAMLLPYVSLSGSDATAYVASHRLDFAAMPGGLIVLQSIEQATFQFVLNGAIESWNSAETTSFTQLPPQLQTLVFDISYFHGSVPPSLENALALQQWPEAKQLADQIKGAPPDRKAGWNELIDSLGGAGTASR